MSEPLRKRDVQAMGDRLGEKLDGITNELVTDLHELRADIRRVFRRTLVQLTVSMTILNGITFTAYVAVLKG